MSYLHFKCVKEGGRLRVKCITNGYNKEANCQFPKAIRKVDREYIAPIEAVSFAKGPAGKFFYRVKASQVQILTESNKHLLSSEGLKARLKNNKVYDDSTDDDCVICLDVERALVFVPCGHYCVCQECFNTLKSCSRSVKCPMCRTNVELAVTRDMI